MSKIPHYLAEKQAYRDLSMHGRCPGFEHGRKFIIQSVGMTESE
jgi:hypothetical protein